MLAKRASLATARVCARTCALRPAHPVQHQFAAEIESQFDALELRRARRRSQRTEIDESVARYHRALLGRCPPHSAAPQPLAPHASAPSRCRSTAFIFRSLSSEHRGANCPEQLLRTEERRVVTGYGRCSRIWRLSRQVRTELDREEARLHADPLTGVPLVKRTRSRFHSGAPASICIIDATSFAALIRRQNSTRPPGSSDGPTTLNRLYAPTTPLSSFG